MTEIAKMRQELRQKMIDTHVKAESYNTILKQLYVPVTTAAMLIESIRYGNVTKLLGC